MMVCIRARETGGTVGVLAWWLGRNAALLGNI